MKILQSLVGQIFEVSLAAGLVIAILLLIRPILGKRYQSKTFYWIWLLISLRLAIPVNFSIFPALININATDTVLIQSASPEADDTALSGIEPVSQQDVADDSDSMQTAPAENILTVGQLVSIIWISGAGIFFAGNLIEYLRFRHKVRRWSKPWADNEGMELFNELKRETGASNVSVALCCVVPSPLVIGFIRPTLLLSKGDYTRGELEAVFRHELIHLRRRDLWYKLLLLIARSIHWFNPIVHLMARRAEEDLEISCDEAVVKGKPTSFQSQYGHAVLSAAEYDLRLSASLTTHFKGGKNTMKERLSAIAGKNGQHRGSLIVILIAAAVTLAAAGCSLNSTVDNTSTIENDLVLIQKFSQDDVKIVPEIPEYDFNSAGDKGDIGADGSDAKIHTSPEVSKSENDSAAIPPEALSSDVQEIKDIVEAFAAAYFTGDIESIQLYLTTPYDWDTDVYEGAADEVSNISVKGLADIGEKAVGDVCVVSLEYKESADSDTFNYLTIELIKQSDGWKIQFYGVEG